MNRVTYAISRPSGNKPGQSSERGVNTSVLLCTVLVLIALVIAPLQGSSKEIATAATADGITYPVTLFNDGNARHFQHRTADGIQIRYFILKSSDGVIRAAFDACDVCWREGKGYFQKGDFMVCKNCGRQFRSTRVNEVSGGCNPHPLTRKIESGKVVIRTADLIQGRGYFNLKAGSR